jgi:hypothetical protein
VCRAGVLEFRKRLTDGQGSGWLCDNPMCGYRTLVHPVKAQSFRERRRELIERSARAHRRSMMAVARGGRLKQQSSRIRESHPANRKK